ncbi:MAG TPA: cytochrome c biogenesis protein CcsA [candidate division Zixibacteria bacterium]|nr:cytochrome c biogenesis protein CcsA [candidate division Zixibacteria bacterium]
MAYLGKFSLYFAFIFSLFSLLSYFLVLRGKNNLILWGRRCFYLASASILLAVTSLLYLILSHNFQVAYVYNYSSTDLPLHYLIATFWGGQEGTFLLWIFFGAILGTILTKKSGIFEKGNLFFFSLIQLGILVILLKRSPFLLLPNIPAEGVGLNPLLQNYWMTIHPVVMFVGFASTGVPFVFALSALLLKEYDSWLNYVFPWAIFSFLALGTALTMGGFWAYEVLGWGGYWGWDPVENASLIPWLFSAGLIHAIILQRKKGALKRSALLLGILPFLAVVYGTFLTRSGVLADFSVHSFLDLGINLYLIIFLFTFLVISLGLLLFRFKDIKGQVSSNSWFSREFLVFSNIIGMILTAVLVLLGMSAPLLTRWFYTPSNVQTAYYNVSVTPIVIMITFLLGLLPVLKWGENQSQNLFKGLRIPLGLALLGTFLAFFLGVKQVLFLLFIFLAGLAFVSNLTIVIRKLKEKKISGAFVVHSGVAILLIGVIASNVYEKKTRLNLQFGVPQPALGYTFTYQGKDLNSPQEKTSHKILVSGGNSNFVAKPKQYFTAYNQGVMQTPYIKRYLLKDLYISPIHVDPHEELDPAFTEETFQLQKGEEKLVKGYMVKFVEFEMQAHDDLGPRQVGAVLEIVQNGRKESVIPQLLLEGSEIKTKSANFNFGRATVYLEQVNPEEKLASFRIVGQSTGQENPELSSFTIEVAVKPLINLFWGGAILAVIGGIFSFRKRWKQVPKITPEEKPSAKESTQEKVFSSS